MNVFQLLGARVNDWDGCGDPFFIVLNQLIETTQLLH
jgi:hypothetical protein